MAAETAHVDERLDAWLDHRLDGAERRAVEDHLAGCAECRELYAALVAGRGALRSALPDAAPPAGLEARIRAALDREDEAAAVSRPASAPAPATAIRLRSGGRRGARTLLPLAAGLALALLAGWWLTRGQSAGGPVDAAFEQLAELEPSALPAELRAPDAFSLESRWDRAGLGFPVRVIDLSAMGIELAGGDITELAGVPAARAIYRAGGSDGPDLVACWMFEAEEADLPVPAEVRRHRGFEFRIYRRGGATLVVWREGGVLCALAGRGEPEAVIRLAFGKAMTPGASTRAPSPS